jgi:hypothetical protein
MIETERRQRALMKKSTPYDSPEPRPGEMSASQESHPLPQAEIVTEIEEDGEVLELVGRAYFTVVDEETGPQAGDVEQRAAESPSPLPHGRERGTSFTPERSGLDRGANDSATSAAPGQSLDPDPSPEEIPFGPPPVLVLAGAVVLLLLVLALWR